MVDAGKILITPKGNWSNLVSYEKLDLVTHSGKSWLSRANDNVVEPSDEAAEWMVYAIGGGGVSEDAILSYPNTQTVLKKTVLDAVEANPSVEGTMANNLKNVNSKITNNILNPSLQSQVVNGVTFTNNNDGTITVNGTATDYCSIELMPYQYIANTKLRICGCPSGGSSDTYSLALAGIARDTGEGKTGIYAYDYSSGIYIQIKKDTICNNLVFKPMLTTNLQATYDDFVPYTGSTGRLNGDLADALAEINSLKNQLNNLRFENGVRIVSFADGTWEQINDMIEAHYAGKINIADYWSVGDIKTGVPLSAMSATGVGESHVAQKVDFVIIGINHDDLATPINGKTKSAVTIHMKDCLKESGYMNSEKNAITYGRYSTSQRRNWINDVFEKSLPTTLQTIIKSVTKKTFEPDNAQAVSSTEKCFLLSNWEVFGAKYSVFISVQEGTQYDYYKTQSNRIKYRNGSANSWWFRSGFFYSNTTAFFVISNENGSAADINSSQNCSFSVGMAL